MKVTPAKVINDFIFSKASPTPTGTEAAVCRLIAERQALGIRKYGQTVAENPLALRQWLQHALEETLDLAVYLKRSIEEIEKRETENAS